MVGWWDFFLGRGAQMGAAEGRVNQGKSPSKSDNIVSGGLSRPWVAIAAKVHRLAK